MEPYSDHTSQFKLALCQLTVTNNKADNLVRARKMLEDASHMGAKLAVLPEMWVCPYSQEYFTKCAEELDGENQSHSPAYSMLSNVAFTQGITIVGGSIPELRNGRLYNTCCIFGCDGQLKGKHRKLHLFDYDAGEASFRESDYFAAGDSPTVVDTAGVGRIGVGICHDIRFPELAMLYKRNDPAMTGVDLIIYPSAFNVSTGRMLWELEAKARAVDNQVFVALCSPSRDSEASYTIWGHSMVVGPNGEVKAIAGQKEKLVIAEIDYCENQLQRERFPLHGAVQDKIYQFLSK
ncbi:omega-amidase, chloroplastic-like [Silene latifolia]|uniref:omega-amidase, chloroplastic-like n=1 Tax=Silene latifolia TaxID=37657 RepID=UPI003D77E2AF